MTRTTVSMNLLKGPYAAAAVCQETAANSRSLDPSCHTGVAGTPAGAAAFTVLLTFPALRRVERSERLL